MRQEVPNKRQDRKRTGCLTAHQILYTVWHISSDMPIVLRGVTPNFRKPRQTASPGHTDPSARELAQCSPEYNLRNSSLTGCQ